MCNPAESSHSPWQEVLVLWPTVLQTQTATTGDERQVWVLPQQLPVTEHCRITRTSAQEANAEVSDPNYSLKNNSGPLADGQMLRNHVGSMGQEADVQERRCLEVVIGASSR